MNTSTGRTNTWKNVCASFGVEPSSMSYKTPTSSYAYIFGYYWGKIGENLDVTAAHIPISKGSPLYNTIKAYHKDFLMGYQDAVEDV
jgi:hypothetical protein